MTKFILGFSHDSIELLAQNLIQLLDIKLYKQMSPMIGTWFSSDDIGSLMKAMRNKEPIVVQVPSIHYELMANDAEPGYTSPTFPEGGEYLLYIKTGNREKFSNLLAILEGSELEFQILAIKEKR